jgi:CheY-like chemotaxis protein
MIDWWAAIATANEAFGGLMITPHPQPSSQTRPPRILIVEDDLVIALMIEELVREFGYKVSSVAPTVAMARLQIAMRNFDCVLLDINLEGESRPEIADVLLEAGVPFAFVTGYDYVLEPRHEGVLLLEKPFGTVQLRILLEKLVGPGSSVGEDQTP